MTTATMPETCPVCNSTDIQEKHEGDPATIECVHCDAFWYVHNTLGLEIITGSDREAANSYFSDAEDSRLFGDL